MNHSVGQDLPFVSVESFVNLPGRGLSATLSRIEVNFCGLGIYVQELRICQFTYKVKNLYLSLSSYLNNAYDLLIWDKWMISSFIL